MPDLDLSPWLHAPRQRTASYLPVYSAVSRAIQEQIRSWIRAWIETSDILNRPRAIYPILFYVSIHPHAAKAVDVLTHDIQDAASIRKAFGSGRNYLPKTLASLNTKHLPRAIREQYLPYLSANITEQVSHNRRPLYRLLNAETVIVHAFLKFALSDIPQIGVEESAALLRKAVATQLARLSDEFDFRDKADELIGVATDVLASVHLPDPSNTIAA